MLLLEVKQQNCTTSKPTLNQSQGKRKKRTTSIATKMPLSQPKKSKGADHNSDSCMENDSMMLSASIVVNYGVNARMT